MHSEQELAQMLKQTSDEQEALLQAKAKSLDPQLFEDIESVHKTMISTMGSIEVLRHLKRDYDNEVVKLDDFHYTGALTRFANDLANGSEKEYLAKVAIEAMMNALSERILKQKAAMYEDLTPGKHQEQPLKRAPTDDFRDLIN